MNYLRVLRRKRYMPIAAGLLLLIAWRPATAHDEHDNLPSSGVAVKEDRLTISPEAEKSLAVETTVVHLKTLERDVMANGAIEVPWRQHGFATSLVAGRIVSVLVQPGDPVGAGQELARVESQEIESLQVALLKAANELDLAGRLLAQRSRLADSGSISERRLLESQTSHDQWAAERGIAVRKLLSLGFTPAMLDELLTTGKPIRTVPITSPIHGVISAADVHAGQVVEPWQQVYEIVDMSTVWVHGQVLESDSSVVKEGQPLEVKVDALPDMNFTGAVDHVGVKLDPELRSLHIHVELANPEGLLRQGMFGRLRIRATVVPDAVACPIEAVFDERGESYVLVSDRPATSAQPATYIRQRVKLGLRSGGFVDVLDGLYPGDPVVTVGKQELASLFDSENALPKSPRANGSVSPPAMVGRRQSESRRVGAVVAQAQVELPTSKKALAYSTVTGRVKRVLVEHGEPVRAGQVLAEIESLDLRNIELDLLQTMTRLRLSQKLLDRYSHLSGTGAIAQKDLWQIETDTENFKASADGLTNKLAMMGLSGDEINRIAELDITESTSTGEIRTTLDVRAPIDGRITLFDLSIGQVVRPQDQLFEVHDVSRVVVRGFVHEQDSASVAVGQPVTITITADPRFSVAAAIDRTAPTLSTWGRAMSIFVELDNSGGELKEGMLARMAIAAPIKPAQAAGSVPETSEAQRLGQVSP